MNFLHQEFDVGPTDVVEVVLDHAANVLLMDSQNFQDYRAGRPYRYYGGYARSSPMRLAPPYQARWHVVVDLGGMGGTVRAGIRIISAAHSLAS